MKYTLVVHSISVQNFGQTSYITANWNILVAIHTLPPYLKV